MWIILIKLLVAGTCLVLRVRTHLQRLPSAECFIEKGIAFDYTEKNYLEHQISYYQSTKSPFSCTGVTGIVIKDVRGAQLQVPTLSIGQGNFKTMSRMTKDMKKSYADKDGHL